MPEDVAIVGYDDMEPASWSDPPLTTVRQEVEEMGRLMAGLLLRRLGVAPPDEGLAPVITQARLIVRAST